MCCLKFISKLLAGSIGAMLLLALLLHGATNQEFLHRDKNGTSGGAQKNNGSQTTYLQEVTSHCSLNTERGGFEPPVPCGTPVFETGTFGHSVTSPVE